MGTISTEDANPGSTTAAKDVNISAGFLATLNNNVAWNRAIDTQRNQLQTTSLRVALKVRHCDQLLKIQFPTVCRDVMRLYLGNHRVPRQTETADWRGTRWLCSAWSRRGSEPWGTVRQLSQQRQRAVEAQPKFEALTFLLREYLRLPEGSPKAEALLACKVYTVPGGAGVRREGGVEPGHSHAQDFARRV